MNEKYKKLLFVIDDYFESDALIIEWKNGLKIRCKSFTGICETDTEPGDENYIGEYSIGVNEVEILSQGDDDSVEIYDNSIEISLKCIPEKVSLEDGTVLWENKNWISLIKLKQNLNSTDIQIIKELIKDLRDALGGE